MTEPTRESVWDEAFNAGMTYARADDDWYDAWQAHGDRDVEAAPLRPVAPTNPYRQADAPLPGTLETWRGSALPPREGEAL